MADYSRPASGFRFKNIGMKTNAVPDSLPEFKYPYLQNIRSYSDSSIISRPQIAQVTAAPGGANNAPVTALEATQGIYKAGSKILQNGVVIDTGYQPNVSCSIVPYRPNASPNAYDYVFDDLKGSKIFVPSSGAPVVQKIGIAEPQAPADICPDYFFANPEVLLAANFTPTGTAGALSDITRSTENIISDFPDPASNPSIAANPRLSVEVGTTQKYQIGETLNMTQAGNTIQVIVQDVIPPTVTPIAITGVKFFAGTTGRCILTISFVGQSSGILQFSGIDPQAPPALTQEFLTSFRRGAVLLLQGGIAEKLILLSATLGPQNAVCIEAISTVTHAAGETLSVQPTIIFDGPTVIGTVSLTSTAVQSTLTTGTAFIDTNAGAIGQFFGVLHAFNGFLGVGTNILPRVDDYIHLSVNVSDLTLLTSIRLILDVNNGAADFVSNAYYFEISPNDLVPAVANTQSQLGATQVAIQRQLIRAGINRASGVNPGLIVEGIDPLDNAAGLAGDVGTGFGGAGDTSTLGVSQWSEIVFPITALTRIGNDQTRTLLNTQKVRIQIICTGGITVQIGSLWVAGGGNPDVGTGQPYVYRIRGRNSITGSIGNPSPANRFGILCTRQNAAVVLPNAAFDTQVDTYDVFRYGGQVSSWRYVGSGSPSTIFYDNLFDSSIINGDALSFDNYEPFPSIGPPITSNIGLAIGTTLQVTFPLAVNAPSGFGTLTQIQNILPGTLVNINNQIYTLWTRPTFISSTVSTQTWLLQLVENIGTLTNPMVIIQEPAMANQNSGNVWGPDVNGTLFCVQAGTNNNGGINGLRSGLIQWTNPNNPDSASDQNTSDICPPTEPLQNGEILGTTPVVFSANRAWQGFPQGNGGYNWTQVPTGAGLAAQYAICSDGENIYFVAKDGIRATAGGQSQNLSDADLYNIFPHEGLIGPIGNITYAGKTVFAPDYTYAGLFQLNVINRFLYFDYYDSTQTPRTLVCDLRSGSWSVDIYSPDPITIHVGSTSAASTQLAAGPVNQQLFMGDTIGAIYNEVSVPINGAGESIVCSVASREEIFGDLRANKLFGDAMLDVQTGGALSITPVSLGQLLAPVTVFTANQARQQIPATIDLGGQQNIRSLGLMFDWTDKGNQTRLIAWQPSYITQPDTATNRIGDWDNGGSDAAKFIQGFLLEADTFGANKNIAIRSADDLGIKQTFVINHNGQQAKPYTFTAPFIAHLVRLEPDQKQWRQFGIKWVFQPTPEAALNWITQPTSHSLPGYQHVPQIMFPYNAPAPVILTMTVDGTPLVVNLPASNGYVKLLVKMPANKGLVFQYAATSTQPFQVWVNDIEIFVGEHGRTGAYKNIPLLGDNQGPRATI